MLRTLEVCERIYSRDGAAGVNRYATDHPEMFDGWEFCGPCEAEAPQLDRICAVCGSIDITVEFEELKEET